MFLSPSHTQILSTTGYRTLISVGCSSAHTCLSWKKRHFRWRNEGVLSASIIEICSLITWLAATSTWWTWIWVLVLQDDHFWKKRLFEIPRNANTLYFRLLEGQRKKALTPFSCWLYDGSNTKDLAVVNEVGSASLLHNSRIGWTPGHWVRRSWWDLDPRPADFLA